MFLERVLGRGTLRKEIHHSDALRDTEPESVVREVELWNKPPASYLHRMWLVMAWAAEVQPARVHQPEVGAMVLIVGGTVDGLVVHTLRNNLLSCSA